MDEADPGTVPRRIPADARRLALRIPLWLLATGAMSAAAILLARLALGPLHALGNAAQAAGRILPICIGLYAYIRFVYVARTELIIDASGVTLHQPLAIRHASWPDILMAEEAGPLTPTHRGGLPIAVRLKLRTGPVLAIPDIFAVRRAPLATFIARAQRAHRA